jgi:hypothetical protein
MPGDIQHELAYLLKEIGDTGTVTLVVPAPLARRLVAGHPCFASEHPTKDGLADLPATVVDGLTVRYAVGDLPEDRALVRTEKAATVLLLPRSLRFAR